MTYSMICKIGTRKANEDSAACIERGENRCFVVADGLGGHGSGDVAAGILVSVHEREFMAKNEKNGEFLARVFALAQKEIIAERRSAHDMKTTGVALSIIDGSYAWCHIGDSRLYHFRRKRFRSHTLDHSVPQMLVHSGEIKDDDIRHHPDRNKLLRALGDEWDSPLYEVSKEKKLSKHDAFLLCTDGFWEHLPVEAITQALKNSNNADEWLASLLATVETSAKDKNMDNYTAITVIAT